jgi:microcystin degradation protein MlrC
MRAFIAGLATETNTFSPIPAGRLAFSLDEVREARREGRLLPAEMLDGYRALFEADGHSVVQSIYAGAAPAAPAVRLVYEELREMILEDLRAAGPIDIVMLALHGAMVAQGYDDCEGDLLRRVREIAPDAVIGAEFDPHCSLTEEMVANADIMTILREYPHIDFAARGEDLYHHCIAIAEGSIRPVAAMFDCRMTGFFPTFDPPMKPLVDAFRAASDAPGIVTAELVHGFPWGDVPAMGARVLVYADGDAGLAATEAERLARLLYDQRDALMPTYPDLATSLDRAASLDGLTVLGDFADNPGGGAPGDSTFVLRAMLERGITDAAIGAFYDPEAARLCCDAGPGAILRLRLGGKLCPESGDALDLEVEVLATADEHHCSFETMRAPFERSAAVRCNGIDILIVSTRAQLYGADGFTGIGIMLEDKRLAVVKSSNHYTASFGPLARNMWHMATPGAMSLDFATIDYRRLDRPMHPMTPDPWAVGEPPRAVIVDAARRQS